MITGAQVRAGRALLGISAIELARRAGLGAATVVRVERSQGVPTKTQEVNLRAIEQAFARANIGFIWPGETSDFGGHGVRFGMGRPLR